jgi:ligand-binding SRPBCC domain-containing protein
MPKIVIKTNIRANRKIVFDLSRSIDLHKISTKETNEEAIGGKTFGLIGLNETVTWRAKHFGIYQNLTSKVTEFDRPNHFTDEMVKGAFNNFKHEHQFIEVDENSCIMIDVFNFISPMGILGRLVDNIILQKYITNLLTKRNAIIQEFAESEKWKKVLP